MEAQPYPCEEVLMLLADYLDQELAPEEMLKILQHLETCQVCTTRCQQEYRTLAEMRNAVQDFTIPVALLPKVLDILMVDTE